MAGQNSAQRTPLYEQRPTAHVSEQSVPARGFVIAGVLCLFFWISVGALVFARING